MRFPPFLPTALLAVAAYLNSLDNPFVFDDHLTVVTNDALRDPANWLALVLRDRFRPLVNLSYAADHAIWGMNPFGYHLTNVALHAVNTALLFVLARRLAQDGRDADSTRDPAFVALAASAVFAVHPIATEAVGYVSGRAELLCATFFLSSLTAMLHGITTGRRGPYIAAFALLVLAMASKEVAAAYPLVLVAYELLLADPRGRRRRWRRLHLPLLSVFVLLGTARIIAFLALEGQAAPRAWWQHALTQAIVFWRYVGLLFAPVDLSVVHSVHVVERPTDALAMFAVAAFAAGAWLAVAHRRRRPLLVFGAAWLALLLLPSSALPLLELMAEHRVYLASAGFCLAAAVVLERLPVSPRAGLAVVVVALAARTVVRNQVWSDPVRLWSAAVRSAPDVWVPHYALGDAYREEGRCQEAIEPYERAIAVEPGEPRAYVNLALCLIVAGQPQAAEAVLTRAVAVAPRSTPARNNLALLLAQRGEAAAAAELFRGTLAIQPASAAAARGLMHLNEESLGDVPEALRLCRIVGALEPGSDDGCLERLERRLVDPTEVAR